MNSNLTPKVITDKNGVTTTRWVKPLATPPASSKPLPPIPSAAPQGFDRLSALGHLYEVFAQGDHMEFDPDETAKNLKASSDHTLRLVGDFLGNEGYIDEDRITRAAGIINFYRNAPHHLNAILMYSDALYEKEDERFNEDAIIKLYKCAELPPMEDYSKADEETQSEIRRLLKSAENYYDEEDSEDWSRLNIILSENLRSFIDSSSKEDQKRIKEIMDERDTEDLELIKTILNSETPSISSGLL